MVTPNLSQTVEENTKHECMQTHAYTERTGVALHKRGTSGLGEEDTGVLCATFPDTSVSYKLFENKVKNRFP